MATRKSSAWSSWADNHARSLVGTELKEEAINELGEDRVVDVQFGNMLGWLKDCGCHSLAERIKESIEVHNAQYVCPSCGADLVWDKTAGRNYCGAHGYVD